MPDKSNSKIFSTKNILLTVGAIVALMVAKNITKPPKEPNLVKMKPPKDWE